MKERKEGEFLGQIKINTFYLNANRIAKEFY